MGDRLATIDMGRKLKRAAVLFRGHNRRGPRIIRTQNAGKAYARKFRKWGAAVPLSVGKLGPHLTQCGQGRGLRACQISS